MLAVGALVLSAFLALFCFLEAWRAHDALRLLPTEQLGTKHETYWHEELWLHGILTGIALLIVWVQGIILIDVTRE